MKLKIKVLFNKTDNCKIKIMKVKTNDVNKKIDNAKIEVMKMKMKVSKEEHT